MPYEDAAKKRWKSKQLKHGDMSWTSSRFGSPDHYNLVYSAGLSSASNNTTVLFAQQRTFFPFPRTKEPLTVVQSVSLSGSTARMWFNFKYSLKPQSLRNRPVNRIVSFCVSVCVTSPGVCKIHQVYCWWSISDRLSQFEPEFLASHLGSSGLK